MSKSQSQYGRCEDSTELAIWVVLAWRSSSEDGVVCAETYRYELFGEQKNMSMALLSRVRHPHDKLHCCMALLL